MEPRVVLRRLTESDLLNAMQRNDEDDGLSDADYADEEEPPDEITDSEEDNESDCEANSSTDNENESDQESKVSTSGVYIGRDGTEWQKMPIPTPRQSTCFASSFLHKVNLLPGQHLDTHIDHFGMIFDKRVFDIIVRYTNIEGKKHDRTFHEVDGIEMKAFIGLLIAAGVDRSSKRNYAEFWGLLRGMHLFKATMSLKRFRQILRYIRFDDKDTRSVRRMRDKLAPIRDLFDLIIQNLNRMYLPGPNITVNEQLVPFRGRCSFKQYLPSKPDKCGLKIFWVCDSETWYPLNGIAYLGCKNSGSLRRINVAQQIVLDLCQPYFKTHRNVTFDNFFTSYDLAQKLHSNGLTCVGAVKSNQKFIPNEFLSNRHREIGSNLFGFRPTMTLLSHVPRHNKVVIILSTLNHTSRVDEDSNAEINKFYNMTKGGVDVLQKLCHTYSVQRKTNRWPLAFFMNLINVSGIASYIMWRVLNGKLDVPVEGERRNFLIRLSSELTYEHIIRRDIRNVSSLDRRTIIDIIGNTDEKPSTSHGPTNKKRRCCMRPQKIGKMMKQTCNICRRNVCKEHAKAILRCKNCARQPIINSSDSE